MVKKLKSMVCNNLGLKLLSVVIAIVLWGIIMNMNDPVITKTIDEIPIERINEEQAMELLKDSSRKDTTGISDAKYTYVCASPEIVTIIIRGKRSKIERLTASDFKAYINFLEWSDVYALPVHVEAKQKDVEDDLEIQYRSLTMMSGKLEVNESKTIDVEIRTENVPNDFYANCIKKSVSQQNVSGPKNKIKSVVSVIAVIDVNKIELTETNGIRVGYPRATLIPIDQNGAEVTGVNLQIQTVSMELQLLPIREVEVDTAALAKKVSAGKGFYVGNITCRNIRIAGPEELLNRVGKLDISDNFTTMEGKVEKEEQPVELSESFLPSGLYFADSKSVTVTVEFVEKKKVEFDVKTEAIQIPDLDEGLQAIFDAETIHVTLYVSDDNAKTLTAENLQLYLDGKQFTSLGTKKGIVVHSENSVVEDSFGMEEALTVDLMIRPINIVQQ